VIELGAAAKAVLATLGMMAVHGTIVALLAIMLVRAGKLRPAWQAAVWLVVVAKFALPWGPAMPYSLSDLFALFTSESGGGAAVIVVAGKSAAPMITPSIAPSIAWLVLAAVWLAGTAFVLVRGIRHWRASVRMAHAAIDAPDAALDLMRELAARVGVRRPRLAVGNAATGPYVVGIFRATIVVPPALLDDTALLRAALMHELAHVKRRDAFGRMVQLAAVAMFWWLPVVRVVARRLELARERACDAWALESGDVSRPAYARLLLQMAQLQSHATALAAPQSLDSRITSVLGPVARPRLGVLHKLALLGWALLALGGARSATAAQKREVCIYTTEIAEALRVAYPEADADHDGVLSHDEACLFQAELRKRPVVEQNSTPVPQMLTEPLCCNCGESDGLSTPLTTSTCTADGVSR
jgi:beta-lactamase regulating signal transducer with metallopeptidase domain